MSFHCKSGSVSFYNSFQLYCTIITEHGRVWVRVRIRVGWDDEGLVGVGWLRLVGYDRVGKFREGLTDVLIDT